MILATKLDTKLRGQVQILGGPGNPPSSAVTNSAQEIVYHKLQVSVSPSLEFSYDYLPGSGIYGDGTNTKDNQLDAAIQSLQHGTASNLRPLYNMHTAAPNIVVMKPCYIAIELVGPQNLTFQPAVAAINLDPARVGKYSSLLHYDTSFARYGGGVAPPTAEPCYIVCFALETFTKDDRDDYSMFFQFAQSSTNVIDAQVDPHIKNRG